MSRLVWVQYMRVKVGTFFVYLCVLALNYGNEFINNNNNDAIQALPEEMNVKSHSGSHERSAHAYCH